MTDGNHAALAPLLSAGYALVSDRVDRRHFGDRVLVLDRDNLRLRILREKDEWFADLGTVDDAERFDLSIVMRAVAGPSPASPLTRASLEAMVAFLVSTAPTWEQMFSRERYDSTRERLRSLEIVSAKERFGYIAE